MKFYHLILASFFVVLVTVRSYAVGTGLVLNVSINGLHNVKSKNVLSVISLKSGKYYSSDTAKKDICSILESGYFDNVNVIFNNHNGNLIFDVTEKPYVKDVIFKGNLKFSDSKLKNVSLLKKKVFYDSLKLEETKKKILALYVNKGYSDCRIEIYPTLDLDTNKMTITFFITENSKIIISGVKVEGVVSFNKKKIIKLMKTRSGKTFKEEIYKSDLTSIQTFYQDNGFMDYQLVSLDSTYNEARTEVFLMLNISEGNRYKIGSIICNGNSVIGDREIKKAFKKVKEGRIFERCKISKAVDRINEAYNNIGYFNKTIITEFNKNESTGIVDINLSINESHRVYVDGIYIDGLVSTKDKVIRREILVKPGDVLEPKKVNRSIEKIYNLGFIENVELQTLLGEEPDTTNLSFIITESKPAIITFGGGYSTVDKFIGSMQLQHINIFGYGQKLNLSYEFGSKKQNYEIAWTEPWIFNKNTSLSLSTSNIHRKVDYLDCYKNVVPDAYEEDKIGATATIGPRIGKNTGLFFGYSFEAVKLSNIDQLVKEKIENDSGDDLFKNNKTSSIFAQCIYDSRDYIFDPSKGNRQFLYIQLADKSLGSDLNFVKGVLRSTWFFPTFGKFVLSINMEVATIKSYGGSTVPIYEKFYIGGADTIRGYQYKTEIGPENGGEAMGLVNVEYKFPPIVTEKGRPFLRGVIFYDIGGNWKNWNNVHLNFRNERESLHSSVGFGLRFMTPIFPVRIDWGYGFNHEKGKQSSHFHFSFASVF